MIHGVLRKVWVGIGERRGRYRRSDVRYRGLPFRTRDVLAWANAAVLPVRGGWLKIRCFHPPESDACCVGFHGV